MEQLRFDKKTEIVVDVFVLFCEYLTVEFIYRLYQRYKATR